MSNVSICTNHGNTQRKVVTLKQFEKDLLGVDRGIPDFLNAGVHILTAT